MDANPENMTLLLVDDEDDFRTSTARVLARRGFQMREAPSGAVALSLIKEQPPNLVLLDLKMPGMSGIETLKAIRSIEPDLPVIILTGHGDYDSAVAGIRLEILDFLQKPIDVDELAERIRRLMRRGAETVLQEPKISALMVPPSMYPKIYVDDPVSALLRVVCEALYRPIDIKSRLGRVRSALVFDRDERFYAIIRFTDVLKLLIPPSLSDSPYATYFTGMFLAQSKVLGTRKITDIVEKSVSIDVGMPLMEAVHRMVHHHLINIPVMGKGELVGVLRARDVVLEMAHCQGYPGPGGGGSVDEEGVC